MQLTGIATGTQGAQVRNLPPATAPQAATVRAPRRDNDGDKDDGVKSAAGTGTDVEAVNSRSLNVTA